jgi:hypothetical protein
MANNTIKFLKQSAYICTLVLLTSCNASYNFDYVAHIDNLTQSLKFKDNILTVGG